ncbi:radical SAM protein [Candidatus Marinarcus aquaticus]|uniref:Radical SAM protein n=1 Tax=Candidatus Marinarcus aquaticus TaxID=2044504 RepID=A0A4Q0XVR0_9BACT|nr:radical SAM protein [Candidatus Marinarcus aquaticus]RXJ60734.1 radical SAM protein [Candidatus Marinarcus aquaticus]
MIHYSEPLFRPPSEANNVIIQITHGCSYNACSFCSMYETKQYKQKSLDEVFEDIETLNKYYSQAHKIFLADGDALAVDTSTLLQILKKLYASFPNLRRVTSYASPINLEQKSLEELSTLYEAGLKLIYFGIETGSDVLLKKIQKGTTFSKMKEGLNKASQAGFKISATVILGVGGREYSKEHVAQTARLVNETTLNYLSTLQLGLQQTKEAQFYKKFEQGFTWLDDKEMLEEQLHFLEALQPTNKIIFRSNHASNAFALAGTLPKNTNRLIDEVKYAIKDESLLTPSWLRGF